MTTEAIKLPQAIERVLVDAAADPDFCEALLARRLEALDARGHALAPSERALLGAVPEAQLRTVIDRLRDVAREPVAPAPPAPDGPFPPPAGIRPDQIPVPAGIRPDQIPVAPQGIRPDPVPPKEPEPPSDPPPDEPVLVPAGIRPDDPTRGIRPEDPRVRGIRPTRLLIGAAVTAALGGGAYYLLTATHGVRPDRPAAVQPVVDAGAPDAVEKKTPVDEE